MSRLALALLILAVAPPAAEAAPFGELPSLAVAHPARCLRATGAPGEVVRWAPDGADFAQATASGFGAPVHVALGDRFGECPRATAQPSGAAIVVERTSDGFAYAVREPGGGAWSPTQTIDAADGRSIDNPVAAVTARGDAVLAWTDTALASDSTRLLVMRRAAGGGFGAPVELQPPKRYRFASPHIAVGIQDDGTVTALFNGDGGSGRRERLFAAVAAPGAAFGPPQHLSDRLEFHQFSVTVAPDGRALAVVDEGAHTPVLERAPGGTFARVADLGYTESLLGGAPAAALRADGAAIVAWLDLTDVQAYAIRRGGPGPFGRPEKVGAKPERPYAQELADFDGGAPAEDDGRAPQVAFAADGRPLMTWALAGRLGGLTWAGATVATFPGGAQTLSGPLRDADSVTPVVLADGRPAIAWSDVSAGGDFRLHLAIESAPAAPEPAAPAVAIGRVKQIHQGLEVPFHCSAACDVRATAPDGISGRRSLRAAGSGRLKILPDSDPILLRRPGSVPVQVLSGAPGSRAVVRRTLDAKLRVPRLPRLLDLKAVRRGKRVVVTWRTARPLRNASVIVEPTYSPGFDAPFFAATVDGAGRRRFRVSVEPILGDRYVQLFVLYEPDATERRVAVVRVARGA